MLEFTCEYGTSRLRLIWTEQGKHVAVGVADIRLYEADHRTLHTQEVDRFQETVNRSERVLLSVGLSRPYRKTEQEPAYHWLQVNNIHAGLRVDERDTEKALSKGSKPGVHY